MSSILELPAVRRRVAPISVETYHALSEQGLVDERTELLRGIIVEKMTKAPLHVFIVETLWEKIREAVPAGCAVRKEEPLTLHDSEPEPDVAVVPGRREDFRHKHPGTALLAIEVSVSTEEVDREKSSIYAQAGVPEYWLVLPESRSVEVFSQPEGVSYRGRRVFGPGETLASATMPALQIAIDELFG